MAEQGKGRGAGREGGARTFDGLDALQVLLGEGAGREVGPEEHQGLLLVHALCAGGVALVRLAALVDFVALRLLVTVPPVVPATTTNNNSNE